VSSPPPATVTVVGSVTLDGYTAATFGADQQTAFKKGIAAVAKVGRCKSNSVRPIT
jgi:hypothetical protein